MGLKNETKFAMSVINSNREFHIQAYIDVIMLREFGWISQMSWQYSAHFCNF